ncbi:universal stress protein [Sutterella wadsworthensis]|jgi:uspA|uniref:universal stress protein n=1 Tax=Sutterella wadsworthensis TaxID=40545 RepID=UPI0013F5C28E|nr:universal stress protein [Sutterella wadsworthensis]MDU6430706.1 universal stress protein [Sutterella wadsworthensis]
MRILIPVDGSTCSRAAVRFIGARSKFMGEKPDVTLLNVQQNIPGTVIEHFSLEAVRSVYEAEGKAIVEKLAPEIEAYGIEPHMAVRIDDCGPAVAKIAVDDNIDLITMGSRGLSPVKSFFLGSVSRSVLEHTTTPVLLVREKELPERENLRLLLAVDGSDYGESAAAFIADHPGLFGPNPTIDVIFVAPDYAKMALAEIDSVTPAPTLKFFEKENQLAWENAVTPVLATLRDAGFDTKAVKRTGDAAEAIAAYAGENADLIVMGSHGWGKFKSAVLGSTAAKVGAATELPILIIRSDKDELLV